MDASIENYINNNINSNKNIHEDKMKKKATEVN